MRLQQKNGFLLKLLQKLLNVSKVFERCLYDQIQLHVEKILSPYQCGFHKEFSSQHCLIALIAEWKRSVDSDGVFAALMIDLSKTFDCPSYKLLIAKLDAYGFDKKISKVRYTVISQIVNKE